MNKRINMSNVEIKKVGTNKELKAFIDFHYDLYKGNKYDTPALFFDEWNNLSREKNAAFEFCDAEYFLAYKDGKPWAEAEMKTAGKPASAALEVDYAGENLTFVTARILDGAEVEVPQAHNHLSFSISGPGEILATDAGDPTSHAPFHSSEIDAFNGLASAIVRRTGPGEIILSVSSPGLKGRKITLP